MPGYAIAKKLLQYSLYLCSNNTFYRNCILLILQILFYPKKSPFNHNDSKHALEDRPDTPIQPLLSGFSFVFTVIMIFTFDLILT